MKAYKLEVLIINHDNLDIHDIKEVLENANYSNDCIWPQIQNIKEVDIGEWSDDHPLNQKSTCETEYKRLFSSNEDILKNIFEELEKYNDKLYDVFFNLNDEEFEELNKKLLNIIDQK